MSSWSARRSNSRQVASSEPVANALPFGKNCKEQASRDSLQMDRKKHWKHRLPHAGYCGHRSWRPARTRLWPEQQTLCRDQEGPDLGKELGSRHHHDPIPRNSKSVAVAHGWVPTGAGVRPPDHVKDGSASRHFLPLPTSSSSDGQALLSGQRGRGQAPSTAVPSTTMHIAHAHPDQPFVFWPVPS